MGAIFKKPRPLTRLVCSRTNGTARHVVPHMKETCCQVKIVSHKLKCQSTRVSRVLESVISCASEEFPAMAHNNLRIGENHKFFTDVSLGVRRLVWDQEAVNSTFTRPTTFAVIEGYSSTKTFVQGSQHKTHDSEMG